MRSPKRVRQSSQHTTPTPQSPFQVLDASTFSASSETGNYVEGVKSKTPRASPQPIDLDDVLHMLDDQLSDDPADASDATAATMPSRWDRIPFNAFNRLRSASFTHSGLLGSPVNTTVTMASAASMSSPRAGSEFSYRSSSGVTSASTDYSSFWDSSPQLSPRTPTRSKSAGAGRQRSGSLQSLVSKRRMSEREKFKMLASPVLLPTKEEDLGYHGHEIDALNLGGGATPTRRRSPPAGSKRRPTF